MKKFIFLGMLFSNKLYLLVLMILSFGFTKAQNSGEIDTSFTLGANIYILNHPTTIVPLSDGKILSGGYFFSDDEIQRGIIKLNSDGSIDNSFNTEGIGTAFMSAGSVPVDVVTSIVVQEDGKIVIGGVFAYYNDAPNTAKLARLNSDGSLDYSFNAGFFQSSSVRSLALQPDGKILATGSIVINTTDTNPYGVLRLNTDGSIDTDFYGSFALEGGGSSIVIQEDGKILVGGLFTSYDGQPYNRIVRLNEDGSVDTTFNIGTGFNNWVQLIVLQEDGKILAGGWFTEYNGESYNRIIRLNSDGSIDTTFNIGTGFDFVMNISSITIQPNGKILVGGSFTEYNGETHNRIIRLNTDGDVDTTFNTGTGFNGTVTAIALQSDGKILVNGGFNSYNEQPTGNGQLIGSSVRLYGDGSLDVANFDTQHNIDMYPNPANDMVNITNIPENSTIKIFDSIGKLVYNLQATGKEEIINTSGFVSGIYLVQITDNHQKTIKKLIIQ